MEESIYQTPGRSSGPRLYHKKSKTGCITCKRRRVKCDERRPSCTGCSRHGVVCVYPTLAPGPVRRESRSPGASSSNLPSTGQSPSQEFQSQSQSHYQTHQGGPSPLSGSSSTQTHTPESLAASTPAPFSVSSPYPAAQTPFYYPRFRPPNSSTPQPSSSSSSDPSSSSIPDPPESADRRLWELRLLHNYIEIMKSSRQPGTSPPIEFPWTTEVPLLALQDSAILYAILAQSALNLWTRAASHEEKEDARTLQTTYLAMALREQRASVANLTRETADRVCMASLTILHHAYALVQTTVVDGDDDESGGGGGSWQPPLEWLRVGRGTGRVWTVAQGLMTTRRRRRRRRAPSNTSPSGEDEDDDDREESTHAAKIHAFLSSKPNFDMDEIFTEANRQPLLWLLEDPGPDGADGSDGDDDAELDGQITRWVYYNALSYVGWTSRAVEAGEAEFAVQRRLAAFAVWMPDLFEEFCQQRRPRALVVLAWFFRLWIPYGHRWEVNGVGERMVRGIYGVLEERWRGKLEPIMREYGL